MYYYCGLLAAALAAVASAVKFDIPPSGLNPIEGQPIEIFYSEAEGPVTITLKNGPIGDLQTVRPIGNGPAGEGSIIWTPEGLPSDSYALEIVDGSNINYSPQFVFQGTGSANTTTLTEADATLTPTDATTTPTTPAAATSPTNTTLDTTTTDTTTTDATATTTEDTATTTEPINQNDQNNGNPRLGSSMALVLGAAALLATFN